MNIEEKIEKLGEKLFISEFAAIRSKRGNGSDPSEFTLNGEPKSKALNDARIFAKKCAKWFYEKKDETGKI